MHYRQPVARVPLFRHHVEAEPGRLLSQDGAVLRTAPICRDAHTDSPPGHPSPQAQFIRFDTLRQS